MNRLQAFFDSQRKYFEKGGFLYRFYPLFEATETFFFLPETTTQKGPHIRDSLDLKRFMSIVILALIPTFLFGMFNVGYQSRLASGLETEFWPAMYTGLITVLPIVIVSYAVGLFWEFLFASMRGHTTISEGFFVTGLLFPLTLPPTIPLWQVAVGVSFGVVIGKEIFGGTGRNFLNPALTGRAFLFFAYPGKMSGDSVWTLVTSDKIVDGFTQATPLACSALTEMHNSIQSVLEKSGYTFQKLFFGLHPGSIGETSTFLCLIGAALLIATGIANYRIILGGIIGLLGTGWILNIIATEHSSAWYAINPFYHLVMGGFAFGIVYMATDPVSAPGTNASRWIYGIAIGVLTVLIRVFNPAYTEGVMLAILFMNVFAPLLDHIAIDVIVKKRRV